MNGPSAASTVSPDPLAAAAFDAVDDALIVVDAAGRISAWNSAAARLYGIAAADAIGREAVQIVAGAAIDDVRWADAAQALAAGRDWQAEIRHRDAAGREFTARAHVRALVSAPDQVLVTIRDVGDWRALERERELLSFAVDQAAEAVVITDTEGIIQYVNPAFERITGYAREEVIGRNPRLLKSGSHSPDFYREMWERLTAGETFRAEFRNLRKDGTAYLEDATISPVRGADGRTSHYVAVKRDISHERDFLERVERENRERDAGLEVLRSLEAGPAAEDTARLIARRIIDTGVFRQVGLWSFEAEDCAVVLALEGPAGPYDIPRLVPPARSSMVYQNALRGTWVEETIGSSGDRERELRRQGIRATIGVPIHHGGRLVGLIAGGMGNDDRDELQGRTGLLMELATVVGAIMGPALLERQATAASRRRIEAVIADRAFTPHFQPVVHLASGATLGYEVLTRFHDATPPDVVFATAQRCGIGLELEEATLTAALEAADTLPATVNINLNVSPAMILEGNRLARLLGRWGWKVTLEITEHEPIDDYMAVRVALARLGPSVRLAVDDAGAGFASLRHILELRPDTVKLDRALVTDLDSDPTRQALVAGMVFFAARTGFKLLAEGVERESERRALLELGVELGQGYLFGRPAPAPAPVPGLSPGVALVRRPAGRRSTDSLDLAVATP